MSETKFTPGPWRLATKGNLGNMIEGPTGKSSWEGDDGYRAVAAYQAATALRLFSDEEANRLANGHLIAAAPDLYYALLALVGDKLGGFATRAEITVRLKVDTVRAAQAALAKARGEP